MATDQCHSREGGNLYKKISGSRIKSGMTVLFFIFFGILPFSIRAQTSSIDTDNDGLTDEQEIMMYHTDPANADTDGDGFTDGDEVRHGFSPHVGGKAKMTETDFDEDGLSDALEIQFKTDLGSPDTDGDGYPDGNEVNSGYDPNNTIDSTKKLDRLIEINLKEQRMKKILGGVILAEYPISSGKAATPTPKGTFAIRNKTPRAWSKQFSLYMPWWMAFTYQGHGIHELPEWPNGYKEGQNHLGPPVSHGCVRLGIGPAKEMYDWAPIGTPVVVR